MNISLHFHDFGCVVDPLGHNLAGVFRYSPECYLLDTPPRAYNTSETGAHARLKRFTGN